MASSSPCDDESRVHFTFFRRPSSVDCSKRLLLQVESPPNTTVVHSCETSVIYPIICFSCKIMRNLPISSQDQLHSDCIINEGIYKEIRKIVAQEDFSNRNCAPHHMHYIILGFKNINCGFNQVLEDTWKDWTSARYIYMNLPDELGLVRITLYSQEGPQSINIFTYVMLVECHTVETKDKETLLFDFVQRLRAERVTGYISVYKQDLGILKNGFHTHRKDYSIQNEIMSEKTPMRWAFNFQV